MTSGDLLREARRRAGLSQAELARRAGRATSVIGRWERNEVQPSFETLRELIRSCGLELRLGVEQLDHSQDASIELSLALSPEERFDRLTAWAGFLAEAREAVRAG